MKKTSFSVILAAGGMGTRMGREIPKQYIPIHDKPIALHSFEVFLSMPEVEEIVVVCDSSYNSLFSSYSHSKKLEFAFPGQRRQDSVWNAIQKLSGDPLVCIHDAARPFINSSLVQAVVQEAVKHQAAVVGVPVKSTIKICDEDQMILSTPDRSKLWEMQTPQIIQFSLLLKGYAYARKNNLTVTDDVSLVELIGIPVKVVRGDYGNLKVTTPEDLIWAEQMLKK